MLKKKRQLASRSTTSRSEQRSEKSEHVKNDVYPQIIRFFFLEKPFLDQASMTAFERGRESFREMPGGSRRSRDNHRTQRKGETV